MDPASISLFKQAASFIQTLDPHLSSSSHAARVAASKQLSSLLTGSRLPRLLTARHVSQSVIEVDEDAAAEDDWKVVTWGVLLLSVGRFCHSITIESPRSDSVVTTAMELWRTSFSLACSTSSASASSASKEDALNFDDEFTESTQPHVSQGTEAHSRLPCDMKTVEKLLVYGTFHVFPHL
jgi:hypothetical protein